MMTAEPPSVLIIDDTAANLGVVVGALEDHGYRVFVAQDGAEGLQRAALVRPDLILLDVMMPGLDGFEVCRRLKEAQETREIPVIFMTAMTELADKVIGFEVGGVDYITKPFQTDEALARVGTHVALRALQKRLEAQNAELQGYRDCLEEQVAARTEEARLMSFALDRVKEAAYLIDEDARFVYVNHEACRALGYSAAELSTMRVGDIDDSMKSEVWTRVWRERQNQHWATLETAHRRRDGSIFPVEVNASYFEYGGKAYNLALVRDISERKGMEAKLCESEARYRSVVTAMAEGAVLQSADGKIVAVNPSAETILGRSAEQLLGQVAAPPWRMIREDGSPFPGAEHPAMVSLRTGQPQANVVMGIGQPNGALRWISVNAEPVVTDGSGEPSAVVSTFHDITESREAARRLQESYDLLHDLTSRRETAREEERKRIAREIHDELGQHLTALRMGISTMRLQFGSDNPALTEHIRDLMVLTDKTIHVVREVAAALRPAALDAGLAAGIEWLAAEFEHHSGTSCGVSLPDEPIRLDDERSTALFRIVQESLTNVARHAKTKSVSIALARDGGDCVVEVRDRGQGFDPAAASKKSLGLVGMRERALLLGGTISIVSAPGKGCTVTARIPFLPGLEKP